MDNDGHFSSFGFLKLLKMEFDSQTTWKVSNAGEKTYQNFQDQCPSSLNPTATMK